MAHATHRRRGRPGQAVDGVSVLRFGALGPGIVDVGLGAEALQLAHQVDYAGVAQVGTVFLEGEVEHPHARAGDGMALVDHPLDHLGRDVPAHGVVDARAGEQDVRIVADRLCLLDQVVRVDAGAGRRPGRA